MKNIRDEFPILKNNKGLVYFDSGATTLKPRAVLRAMDEYYKDYGANVHRGLYPISQKATLKYEETRNKVAKFISAKSDSEIIFTSGTTASLNLVVSGFARHNLVEGDEIVVTEMEHHSNLVPWQALALEKGLKIKYWPMVDFGLDIDKIDELFSEETKVLAITQVSNVTGTVNPIKEIIEKVRKINPEITVVVDGAQAVAHMEVDVSDLDCDFYAFSGHKMYGPTGVGVLWTRLEKQLQMKPVNFGGGMIGEVSKEGFTVAQGPEGFEAGTPPIAEVIGLGAAVDFILGLGFKYINEQESDTLSYLLSRIKEIEGIKVLGLGNVQGRTGVVSVVSRVVHGHDISELLGRERWQVAIRAGFQCAMPLHQSLGEEYGSSRISLGIYNNKTDVDRLIEGLKEILGIFSDEQKMEEKWTTYTKK